jgi:moderate conductance mechanosensitive channel
MNKILHQLLQRLDMVYLEEWVDLIAPAIVVILIIFLAIITKTLLNRLTRSLETHLKKRADSLEEKKRVQTLARVFRYITSLVVTVVAMMLALSALGFSIAPILATAGVAGIAVGFGAQSLVKDYFTGFVMLLENQIRQGDIIEVGGKAGSVEEVTLRYVRLRDYEGAVHFIPNSNITLVTNKSRSYAYAVIDIGVAYKENIQHVYQVMRSAAQKLRQEANYKDKILDELEIAGVEQLGDFAVVIRARIQVTAQDQSPIRRKLLEEMKTAFDLAGIEIPSPDYRNK